MQCDWEKTEQSHKDIILDTQVLRVQSQPLLEKIQVPHTVGGIALK